MSGAGARTREPLGVIEKVDLVLAAIRGRDRPIGVSEVSRRCGLAKSTTFRTLRVLETVGMVERSGDGYRLGRRLTDFADTAWLRRMTRLRELLLPSLLELYERTHHIVDLAVLRDADVLCLERLYRAESPWSPMRVGSTLPARATALGKVLLAYAEPSATIAAPDELADQLRSVRRDGAAYDGGEYVPGLHCVAVPVRGPRHTVVAAISVSDGPGRFNRTSAAREAGLAARAASARLCSGRPAQWNGSCTPGFQSS